MIASFGTYFIEPIQEKDAWKICDFMVSNEDRLKRYFPKTLEKSQTPTLAKHFAEKKAVQFQKKEEFLFLIKETDSKELVGLVYIKELDNVKKQGEFAYPFEGKGITSQAVKLLYKHAFNHLDINTLQIIVHKDNLPSVKVAENNNFIWKETLKKEFTPVNEKPLDMELYELYNER